MSVDAVPLSITAPLTITPLRWWHVPAVVALESMLFPGDRWSTEQFWGELALPTRHYLVALEGERVVGYGGLFVLPPQSDVQTVAVHPERQGRGIGRALLAELLAVARETGASQVMLEVRSDGDRAIDLYEHAGFVRIAHRRAYYPDGGDADIMRLALAPGDPS